MSAIGSAPERCKSTRMSRHVFPTGGNGTPAVPSANVTSCPAMFAAVSIFARKNRSSTTARIAIEQLGTFLFEQRNVPFLNWYHVVNRMKSWEPDKAPKRPQKLRQPDCPIGPIQTLRRLYRAPTRSMRFSSARPLLVPDVGLSFATPPFDGCALIGSQ